MLQLYAIRTLLLLIGAILCSPLAKPQDATFQQAFALYNAGNLKQAHNLLETAVLKQPSALDLSLLGTIEFQQGNFKIAESHIKQALSLEPKLRGARFTLSHILEAQNRLPEAQGVLEGLVAVDSGNVPVLLSLARLQNAGGHTEAALATTLKAKAVAPNDPGVLYATGALCLQMDLIKDGVENLESAARLDPNPTTLYALASARIAVRNEPAAIEIYQHLLQSDPGNPQINYALGAAYYLSNENDKAKPCFERSIQKLPAQVESFYYLGLIAGLAGDQPESARLLNMVVKRQPGHSRAHLALGQLYRTEGRTEDARRELEIAVRLAPDSQKAHYQLGLLLTKLKLPAEATEQFDIAKQLRASVDDRVSWELMAQAPRTGASVAR